MSTASAYPGFFGQDAWKGALTSISRALQVSTDVAEKADGVGTFVTQGSAHIRRPLGRTAYQGDCDWISQAGRPAIARA